MVGVKVRVHPQVEELIRAVADKLELCPSSVRQVAILLGLTQILKNGFPVWSDSEFYSLLKQVEVVVNGSMGKRKEEEEERTQ